MSSQALLICAVVSGDPDIRAALKAVLQERGELVPTAHGHMASVDAVDGTAQDPAVGRVLP